MRIYNSCNNTKETQKLINRFIKIFNCSKIKEWNINHIHFWKEYLDLNNEGFSSFQNELFGEIKKVLNDYNISFVGEVTEHQDLNDKNRVVKMITLILDDNSKFWIYHDMAEFDLRNEHEIYEKWGYLKPQNLMDRYLESMKKFLKLDNNEL